MATQDSWQSDDHVQGFSPTYFSLILKMILTTVGLLYAVRLYAKFTCGYFRKTTRMDGKTVIVTGCTGGIGKETAMDLADRGARVIMACRNMEASEKIKDEIINATRNHKVFVKHLDLASFSSVRKFADDINRTEDRLDVLIHNAGCAGMFKNYKTGDGIETTMQTNHYGPFLLTHLLIDKLKKSAPSRIVIVASSMYRVLPVDLKNPNPLKTLIPGLIYFQSKEANILFTRELSKRLEGTGITVNCLHPGFISTGIWRSVTVPLNWALAVIDKFLFKTPEQGSQTTIMLAVDEKLEAVSGRYYSDCKESTLSSHVSDMGRARKLWEISEKIAGLQDTDPIIS